MVNSVLSPQKIIGQQNRNPEAFQKFFTGGNASLGSSVVKSAANKIVGFPRGSISPVKTDINNLVNSISNNIINNVDNSIKNTTNFILNDVDQKMNALRVELYKDISNTQSSIDNLKVDITKSISDLQNNISRSPVQSISPVTQIKEIVQNIQTQSQEALSNTISNFSKDYQQKIKGIDDNKPSNVLGKFLDLYRNAIGFVNFFGNVKNIKKVEDNLKALRKLFEDSFNVAKVLRQTIIKIVKQLSNLPVASPNAGGLNIDVGVPGGRLKQSAGPAVKNIGKGAGLLKMGALGLGGLGLGAAGMFAAKQFQETKLSESQGVPSMGMLPGNIVDSLSSILDRFSNAVENLISKTEKGEGGRITSSGGGSKPSKPKPSPGPGEDNISTAVSSAPGDEKLAAFVASMEAASPENAADALQVMLNRSASGEYGKGLSGVLSGYDQFSPISAAIFGKSADTDAEAKYKPIAAKIPGNTPQEKFQWIQKVAAEPDGLNKLEKFFGGGSANVAGTIISDPKYLASSRENVKGALNFYGGRQAQSGDVQFRPGGNWFYNFTGPIGKLGSRPTGAAQQAQISVAPTQTQTTQTRSQAISQPAQQAPQMIQLPPQIMNMGTPPQPQQGGEMSVPPPQQHAGPEVPFLPTSNPDNFFVMYSRMVYNIVDG